MSPAAGAIAFVDIGWRGRTVRVEHQWIGDEADERPLIVFLHEGLGSLAMWRDFPQRLCQAVGARGLVWSRPGYGRSTPRAAQEHWQPDFLHQQAHEVMPALFDALQLDTLARPPWLFGHSDGGSIALLHAARFVERVSGLVVMAPHTHVEPLSLASIAQARRAYEDTDLKQRLARYHDDPDSAFWGWNGAWLNPEFSTWSIEEEISTIRCPLLAVQGVDDEYGTLEQIRGIARRLPQTQLLELAGCGHSPHRDQPQAVLAAATQFIQAQHPAGAGSAPGTALKKPQAAVLRRPAAAGRWR